MTAFEITSAEMIADAARSGREIAQKIEPGGYPEAPGDVAGLVIAGDGMPIQWLADLNARRSAAFWHEYARTMDERVAQMRRAADTLAATVRR